MKYYILKQDTADEIVVHEVDNTYETGRKILFIYASNRSAFEKSELRYSLVFVNDTELERDDDDVLHVYYNPEKVWLGDIFMDELELETVLRTLSSSCSMYDAICFADYDIESCERVPLCAYDATDILFYRDELGKPISLSNPLKKYLSEFTYDEETKEDTGEEYKEIYYPLSGTLLDCAVKEIFANRNRIAMTKNKR